VNYEVKAQTEGDSVFDLKLLDKEVVDETEESVIVDVEIMFYRTFKGDKVILSDNPPQKFVDELKGGFYKEEYKGKIHSDVQDADLYDNKCVRKKVKVELVKPTATEEIQLTSALGEFKGKLGSNSVGVSLEVTLPTADEGCGTVAIGKNDIATQTGEGTVEFFDSQSYNSKSVPYGIKGNQFGLDYRGDGSHFAERTGLVNGVEDGFRVQDQSNGNLLLDAPKQDGSISSVRYSKDGKFLAVSGGNTKFHNTVDSTIVFDAENGYTKVAEIKDGEESDTHDFSKNNKYLAIGQGDGGVAIVDVSNFSVTTRLLGTTDISTVRFDQALETLYVHTGSGNAFTFDVQNNFAKTSRSFSGEYAEWFGGQYLVKDVGSSVEIRDKNDSYNVVDSADIAEDSFNGLDINRDGTKIIVGQSTLGSKGRDSGQPQVYATGFDPGPNLGSVVQTDSSGVKQTNSSGVVLTQA
jgi:hypothetical protein